MVQSDPRLQLPTSAELLGGTERLVFRSRYGDLPYNWEMNIRVRPPFMPTWVFRIAKQALLMGFLMG